MHDPHVRAHLARFYALSSSADVTTMTVLLSIVSPLGLFGNAVVIVVCAKCKTRLPSAQHFIRAIATCDFLICLVIIPYRITAYHVTIPEITCKCFEAITYFSESYSLGLLLAVALDRYMAVCRPVTLAKLSRFAKYCTVLMGVLLLGVACPPGLFAGDYILITDNSTGVSTLCYTGVCYADGTDTRFSSQNGIHIYNHFLGALYFTAVTLLVVLYFNVFFSVYKRFSRKKTCGVNPQCRRRKACGVNPQCSKTKLQRSQLRNTWHSIKDTSDVTNANRRLSHPDDDVPSPSPSPSPVGTHDYADLSTRLAHHMTAKMLLIVTVAFLVTWIPYFLMKLDIVPNIVTVRLLFFWNNMINPVIYSFSNRTFRANVSKLFGAVPGLGG